MRKRQWKKILSVVLALAMVFSMNITAFADEVADPVAVEQPAAEEPAAEQPAETPAAEEPAPADETPAAEEPAPADETPAAEEPEAPADETPAAEQPAAPAEEAAPAEGEEPAGGADTVQGWIFTYTTTAPEVSANGTDVLLKEADMTVAESSVGSGDTVKISSNGTGTATVTLGDGKYVILNNGTFSNTLTTIATSDTTGVTIKKVANAPEAPVETTNYTINKTAADKWTVKAVDGSQRLEYLVATSSAGAYADLDNSTGADITATDKEAGKKMYVRVKAIFNEDDDAVSGIVTTPASGVATIDYAPATPSSTFTVSGYKFTLGEGTTSDNMTYPKGVGQVNLKGEGEVTIEDVGAEQALSVNLIDETTTLAFGASVTDYKTLSILGKGTILVNALTGDPIYAKAFESVAAGISISGNNAANILVSANVAGKAAYIPVIEGTDAAFKMTGEGRVVAVTLAEAQPNRTDNGDPDSDLDPDNHLLNTSVFTTGDWYVLSENKLEFSKIASAKVATFTVSESYVEGIAIPYKSRPVFTTKAASLANAKVIDVPDKGISEWTNRFVTGMNVWNGINVQYDTEQASKAGDYRFTLSNNASTGLADAKKAGAVWTGGDDYSGLISDLVTTGSAQPGKDYVLFGQRLENSETYKSDIFQVCSFKTLQKVRISINKASGYNVSPNYVGTYGVNNDKLKSLAGNTNIINRGFFNFTFQGFDQNVSIVDGYKDPDYGYMPDGDYTDNYFTLVDSDGYRLGRVTVEFAAYNPTMINWSSPLATTPYYQLPVNAPGSQPYAARLVFTSDTTNAQTVYNDWTSTTDKNIVSFNVIKAPVKYEPVMPAVAVSGQVPVPTAANWKATSLITGEKISGYSQLPDFYINGSKADPSTSWNGVNALKAGTYTITISEGNLSTDPNHLDYATNKEKEQADYSTSVTLKVVDKDSADGLKISAKQYYDVYYGTTLDSVKKSLSANFTFGGVDVTGTKSIASTPAELNAIKILKTPSSNALAATAMTNDEVKSLSANSKMYAYYINYPYANSDIGLAEKKVSQNTAIEITVLPRPVDVTIAAKKAWSYRGEPALVSVNKTDLTVTPETGASLSKYDDYTGSATIEAKDFFAGGATINLDTSAVNTNVPNRRDTGKHYTAALTGYTVSADKTYNYAQNYVVDKDSFDYDVLGKWYVKYILEYGGRGAKAGKRYVSSDEVIKEDWDTQLIGTAHKITPSTKVTNSWNGILAEGDRITRWNVKDASTLGTNLNSWFGYDQFVNVTLSDYDFAVYAVVAAKATKEGVRVESITPVRYNGRKWVTKKDDTAKTSILVDQLKVYDEKEFDEKNDEYDKKVEEGTWNYNGIVNGKHNYTKTLVQGTDYTVKYKNNKNASVAYDETVSGNDGVDATFKRIVTDKQMPQVIITGKGNYKSLKTTVLFDILPNSGSWAVTTPPAEYQFAGKTMSTKSTVTHVITVDDIKETTKTYKLKAGKVNAKKLSGYTGDYILDVYKLADNGNGTKTKVTNFKKIAKGDYELVYKGVNNYCFTRNEVVHVVEGQLLSKQTIKTKKKIAWAAAGVKPQDFITSIKTKKKPKTDIALVKYADEANAAGYYIESIEDATTGALLANASVWGDECSEYLLKNAGTYKITIAASQKLMDTAHIFGSHTIKVTVKGTKVTAKNFTIDGKKASKTVVIDYDGKDKLVEVKTSLATDADSKIPTTMPTVKNRTNSKETAVDNVRVITSSDTDLADFDEKAGYYTTGYQSSTDEFVDTGVRLSAALSGKGVYTVSPKAFNSDLFTTYKIKIRPSGKYYAGTKDGYVVLSYMRGALDLSKVVNKGDLFKVAAPDQTVNVGGTPAVLLFDIAGMVPVKGDDDYSTEASSNKLTNNASGSSSKTGYVKYDGVNILQVTYAKNKKVGTATATIKPTKDGKKYFKKSAKVNYNIKKNEVKTVREYAIGEMKNGEVFAVITDAAAANKMSCVLYQMDACGSGVATKLGKKDYKAALGKEDAKKGYTVAITDGTSGNFKFAANTLVKSADEKDNAYFNVYGKKSKVQVKLSDNGYDAAKKGYVYTGKAIEPTVTSLTYGGQTYSFPAGLGASSNFIVTYNNNVKVGTATATVTLKRDLTAASANTAYPYGGTVTVKFKIVPHNNENLILNE